MRNIGIDIKSNAMKMKLKRFALKSINVIGYYGDGNAVVSFTDKAGYVWHVSNRHGTLFMLECKTGEERAWLGEVSKRSTTKNLRERYKASLDEGLDYAIVFDWLLATAKKNGELSLWKLTNFTDGEQREFDGFFLPTDSPESIAVQYDLYACQIDKNLAPRSYPSRE